MKSLNSMPARLSYTVCTVSVGRQSGREAYLLIKLLNTITSISITSASDDGSGGGGGHLLMLLPVLTFASFWSVSVCVACR